MRDRLRDLKARTKSRFNGSVARLKPTESTTGALTRPVTPADSSNLTPTSPSTDALIAPSPNAPKEDSQVSSDTPISSSPIVSSTSNDAPRNKWQNLKALPRVLDPVAGAFGPLKAVINDLVGLVEIYEGAANGQEEYAQLQNELEILCDELGRHFSQPTVPPATVGIESLCRSIQEELEHIKGKQTGKSARKYLEGKNRSDEILACYRRVQTLLQRLSLNVNMSIWRLADEHIVDARSGRMSTQLDRLCPSLSARFNSAQAMELKRVLCTPGTRINVLSHMYSWADFGQGSVYWLNGMAGTGKTTIVYTLCATLDKERRLAASFFCSRSLPECRKVSLIIPLIAYQLARFSHPFQAALSRVLEKDPDVHTSLPDVQFSAMITEPLSEVRETLPENLVIVIDALDECDNKEGTGKILRILLIHSRNLPIKFIVSSRPEPEIRDQMTQIDLEGSRLVLHELEKGEVRTDIEIYLKDALAPMNPSELQIATLVERAGVLFIYAATVVRYVGYDNFRRNPHSRIETVLSISRMSRSSSDKEIDELYSVILKAALDDPSLEQVEIDDMKLVLYTVICAQEPLTVNALSDLLQLYDADRVRAALRPLWSVLHVVGETELVTTIHASFPDYIFSPSRSKTYSCDPQLHNHVLAVFCFENIKKARPQFNICNLEMSYILDEDIPNVEERVQKAISASLFYSCKYWAAHLCITEKFADLDERLEDFLSVRLLLWLEVINLKKIKIVGPRIIQQAENWCIRHDCSATLKRQIRDAWRFTMAFTSNILSSSTPHVYISMLPFWPRSSPIYLKYAQRTRGLIRAPGCALKFRRQTLLGKWLVESSIKTVEFSPDGTKLAVYYWNRVCILDATSGIKRFTLHASGEWFPEQVDDSDPIAPNTHGWVKRVLANQVIRAKYDANDMLEVVGSPSGNLVATRRAYGAQPIAPLDLLVPLKTVILGVWDGDTLEDEIELKGHSGSVTTLAFSYDNTLLASGSIDETICVWDVARIRESSPRVLHGYNGGVISLAFSRDGTRLISSSVVNICVWNPRTGEELQIFNSHNASSVCISPDGYRIAAGFNNRTIQIWDTESGESLMDSLEWYNGDGDMSVAYSPDCSRIVSWSDGGNIYIWDGEAECLPSEPLEGHSTGVSVAFSPDSAYIASVSLVGDICVWNAHDGRMELGPISPPHSDKNIYQPPRLAFSTDNTRVLLHSRGSIIHSLDVKDGQTKSIKLQDPAGVLTETSPIQVNLAPGGTCAYVSIDISIDEDPTVVGFRVSRQRILVWDTRTGEIRLDMISQKLSLLEISPNGARMATWRWPSSTIQIWDVQDRKNLLDIVGEHPIRALGFSYDGTRIASASYHEHCVWDVEDGSMIFGPLKIPRGQTRSSSLPIIFSPSGDRVLYGFGGTILVRDASSGCILLGPLQEHTAYLTSANFSHDGTRIVSGWRDGSIRVYDTHTPDMMTKSQNNIDTTFDWEMREDGWVVDNQSRLLIWVPHDLQKSLMKPRTSLLISREGYFHLDFDNALIGEAWTECYVPESED